MAVDKIVNEVIHCGTIGLLSESSFKPCLQHFNTVAPMKRKSTARHAGPAAVMAQEEPQETTASLLEAEGEGRKAEAACSHDNTHGPEESEGERMANPSSQGAQEKIHVREELRGKVAKAMLSPEMSAACSMQGMMDECLVEAGIDITTVSQMLGGQGTAVADGDLEQARRSLAAQAATLERMFHYLYRLATVAEKHSFDLHERYLRLAMRAQAQSMRTLHVLGRLSPRPAKQAKAVSPQAQKVNDKADPVKAETVRPDVPPAPVPHAVPNRMPAGGWQGPARGGARWGGLSAPKR